MLLAKQLEPLSDVEKKCVYSIYRQAKLFGDGAQLNFSAPDCDWRN